MRTEIVHGEHTWLKSCRQVLSRSSHATPHSTRAASQPAWWGGKGQCCSVASYQIMYVSSTPHMFDSSCGTSSAAFVHSTHAFQLVASSASQSLLSQQVPGCVNASLIVYIPWCAVCCVPLQTGAEFVSAADGYVRRFISRGIPSLFSDLKPLYTDPAKADALQALFEGYAAHLRQQGTMPPLKQGSSSANGPNSSSSTNGPAAANGTSSSNGGSLSGEDNPLTWVLHYLSQHYDRLGQTAAALEASEAALGLAPEVIELLLARAKILKHAGDVVGSAVAADTARRSDLADRYTNSMAVKALFAAGQMELAEQTALLFTRDGDQVSWGQLQRHLGPDSHKGSAVGCASGILTAARCVLFACWLLCPACLCWCANQSVLGAVLLLLLLTLLPCSCVSQLNNLYDMQHMWYEVRSGDAYMAAGQLPKALKKYTSIAKHFSGRQPDSQQTCSRFCCGTAEQRLYDTWGDCTCMIQHLLARH